MPPGGRQTMRNYLATWLDQELFTCPRHRVVCRTQRARICVNVEPGNRAATRFYFRNGAEKLNEHWLVWKNITAVSAGTGGGKHA
jgi:hypothetical protein